MLDAIDQYSSDLWQTLSDTGWWRYLSRTSIWENSLISWLSAIGIALLVLFIARMGKHVLLVRLRTLSLKSATKLDDILVDAIDATGWYFYLVVAAYTATRTLRMDRAVSDALDSIALVVLLIQIGVWLQALITALVSRWAETQGVRSSTTVAAGFNFAFRLIVWVGVLLLALSNLGIEVSAVVAGLGVGGVAAALAVQSLLSDVFASVSMYFDRPFDIGDFIIVDDYSGTIQEIGTRTTRIAGLGGEQLIFANSDLVRSRIRNYARMSERRIAFTFGIEYNLAPNKVARAAEIVREVIEGVDTVRFDRAHFKSFGDYSLEFEAVYYVLSQDYTLYMERQHEINLGMYRRFLAEGIPFALPTRTLHMHPTSSLQVRATNGAAKSTASERAVLPKEFGSSTG